MSDSVTISREEYERLLRDARMLQALRNAGVDNWTWYGEALAEFYADEEE